ncbi:MAG: hypothetical protein ACR2PA_08355 [Hyphomicrobiaceae bacterium]
MKSVKVTYTVRPEFVEENKANIRAVMDALKANPIDGVSYAAFMLDDGATFVHINLARDDEALSELTGMEAFKAFQSALRGSDPVAPPSPEAMQLVGANFAG